jgi:hypothetical protein
MHITSKELKALTLTLILAARAGKKLPNV